MRNTRPVPVISVLGDAFRSELADDSTEPTLRAWSWGCRTIGGRSGPDNEGQIIRPKHPGLEKGREDSDGIPHHDGLLAGHFRIEKTHKWIGWEYYGRHYDTTSGSIWKVVTFGSLWQSVGGYIKGCNLCMASKAVRHKPTATSNRYRCLIIVRWIYPRILSRDCLFPPIGKATAITRFSSSSTDSQRWYKLVKVTIKAPDFAEVILDVVKRHHDLPDSVVTDRGSLFTSKLGSSLSLLYFFPCIRRSPSTASYLQINGPIERPNSTIGAHPRVFVNLESLYPQAIGKTPSDARIRLPHCEEC